MSAERGVVLTWRGLHLADGALRRLLDQRLTSEADCSLLEHDVLTWLAAAPRRRRQMFDLANLVGVTRGGLTRIADRLVQRNWIERDRPETNRREVHAVLTAEGQRAVKRARAVYTRVLAQSLGTHLTAAERDELARITTKLLTALNDGDPLCPPPPTPRTARSPAS
jgi:DNA-binding MarR family transcriptional regulator